MRGRFCRIADAAVGLLCLPFLYGSLRTLFLYVKNLGEPGASAWWFAAGLAFTALVLALKAARFYLVALETRPELRGFAGLYGKTTFVSLLLPRKSGEFYRMYCCGRMFGGMRAGCLAVLADRYFDTVPLLVMLTGAAVTDGGRAVGLVWFLGIFITLATAAYLIIPSACRYLNRFLIRNSMSRRGIAALGWVRRVREWRGYIGEMIEGREGLLLLLSVCAWLAEYAAVRCLARGMGAVLRPGDFTDYLNVILAGGENSLRDIYAGGSVLLLALMAIFWPGRFPGRRKRETDEEDEDGLCL